MTSIFIRAMASRIAGGAGGGGHDLHLVIDTGLQFVVGIDHQVQHDRRAAQVGDAVLLDRGENIVGAHRAQAHAGAVQRGDGPRETPAVAVEHRQRPEVDRVRVHVPGEHVRDTRSGKRRGDG